MSRFASFPVRALALLLAISACKTVPRYEGNGEQEVLNAEHEWANAAFRESADGVASLLDEDYVALTAKGNLVRKPGWTRAMGNSRTRFQGADISNVQVRFPRPDVAVVTGDVIQKGTGGSDNSTVARYINTWVRMHDKWQLVSSGFAPMPANP